MTAFTRVGGAAAPGVYLERVREDTVRTQQQESLEKIVEDLRRQLLQQCQENKSLRYEYSRLADQSQYILKVANIVSSKAMEREKKISSLMLEKASLQREVSDLRATRRGEAPEASGSESELLEPELSKTSVETRRIDELKAQIQDLNQQLQTQRERLHTCILERNQAIEGMKQQMESHFLEQRAVLQKCNQEVGRRGRIIERLMASVKELQRDREVMAQQITALTETVESEKVGRASLTDLLTSSLVTKKP